MFIQSQFKSIFFLQLTFFVFLLSAIHVKLTVLNKWETFVSSNRPQSTWLFPADDHFTKPKKKMRILRRPLSTPSAPQPYQQ